MTTPSGGSQAPQPHQDPNAHQQQSPGAGADERARSRPRSLARVVVPLALAGWIVLEVWLLTVVGGQVGAPVVLLLLLAGLLLGGAVIKRAGLRAWRDFAASLQPGGTEEPPRRSSGAALSMLGGALLMLPGFASDALGLLCLFPPTRALLRRFLPKRPLLSQGPMSPLGEAYQQVRIHRPDGKIVQGEVIDRSDTPDA